TLRHELADEDHAALAAVADVEAQVQLAEVAVARPADAEHPRVEELEGHQADEGLPVAQVQRQPGRQALLEQIRRDGVGREEQVLPAGGQERLAHDGAGPPGRRRAILWPSGRLPATGSSGAGALRPLPLLSELVAGGKADVLVQNLDLGEPG